jgi:site-specific DNA-cytosine methylase
MTRKPDCAWNLTDLADVPQNGITVMSTFACGGGSSMGYKRAGCSIVAANDIDPEMAWHYKHNLHPQLYYLEWKRLGSYPDDYHAKTDKIGKYMIGMSVPPKMTEQVARAVIDQWLIPNGP